MTTLTIVDYINRLPQDFEHPKAKGIVADLQLIITGFDGGEWYLSVNDGAVKIREGYASFPEVEVEANSDVALRLIQGKQNPMTALITGKVKVKGNKALLMKMIRLIQ
ncbi:MAG: SCP2 sterol-binding domain-containing protein [Chloroflexi bacterium]|jgi:putative sterol carrier protein|nr:SCP2 sterol-binding domain-containing protein [Chloroflexota bacterium]